jgi:membrane protease YdiL (CAAX protease family)
MRRQSGVSLVAFFALAYALMWPCFIAVAMTQSSQTAVGHLLLAVGTFAPALSAIGVTAWHGGRDGVRTLLAGLLRWRVGLRWYVFAGAFTVAIKLTAAVIVRLGTGAWPRFGTEPLVVIAVAVLISAPFQAGEELGWRAFALPRLSARMGLGPASLLLGGIWACWHLPQFFVASADTYGQSFAVFAVGVVAFSVVLAWVFARTNGSVALTMLLHSAYNNSKDIVPSAVPGAMKSLTFSASPVAWTSVGLMWVCATYFLSRMWTWHSADHGDVNASGT